MNIKKRKKLGTLLRFIVLLPMIIFAIIVGLITARIYNTMSVGGMYEAVLIYLVFQVVVFIVCAAIGYYYEAIDTPLEEQNAILEEMVKKEKKSNNEKENNQK